jgi:uncharacterized ion transporter superfamily protein YfcC
MIASWFLPITDVNTEASEFTTTDSNGFGIFSIFTFFSSVLQIFGNIPLYILAVGGFYGILHNIPQYRVLLDKIANGFENKEWLFMIVVGTIIALLSSIAGLSFPIIFIFPFVISVVLLMGYDKITAALLTVGSVSAGLIGTVFSNTGVVGSGFSYSTVSGLSNIYEQIFNGQGTFAVNENILPKTIILLISLITILSFTVYRSIKHKNKDKIEEGIFIPKKVEVKKKSIAPLAIVFDLTLIVLALAFISWSVFKVDVFSNVTDFMLKPTGGKFTNGIFGAFGNFLGMSNIQSFGNWTLVEASAVVVISSILLAYIYRMSFNTYIDSFKAGLKAAFEPALLVSISMIVLVAFVEIPIGLTILRPILSLTGGVNIFIMMIVALFFCYFVADPFFCVALSGTYIGTVAEAGTIGLVAFIWQEMYGISVLISPMSFILLPVLAYLGISYGKWMKTVWIPVLILFGSSLLVSLII